LELVVTNELLKKKNINFTLANLTQKHIQEQVDLDFAKSILEQTPIYVNINFSLFNNT
jgi:hypothetical protein